MRISKYYCDWCGKEMSKLFYFTGSHMLVFGRYNYDEVVNEEHVCEECYNAFKELRRTKQEIEK